MGNKGQCRPEWRQTPQRQTRARSKLAGSSPLMAGLDYRGQPIQPLLPITPNLSSREAPGQDEAYRRDQETNPQRAGATVENSDIRDSLSYEDGPGENDGSASGLTCSDSGYQSALSSLEQEMPANKTAVPSQPIKSEQENDIREDDTRWSGSPLDLGDTDQEAYPAAPPPTPVPWHGSPLNTTSGAYCPELETSGSSSESWSGSPIEVFAPEGGIGFASLESGVKRPRSDDGEDEPRILKRSRPAPDTGDPEALFDSAACDLSIPLPASGSTPINGNHRNPLNTSATKNDKLFKKLEDKLDVEEQLAEEEEPLEMESEEEERLAEDDRLERELEEELTEELEKELEKERKQNRRNMSTGDGLANQSRDTTERADPLNKQERVLSENDTSPEEAVCDAASGSSGDAKDRGGHAERSRSPLKYQPDHGYEEEYDRRDPPIVFYPNAQWREGNYGVWQRRKSSLSDPPVNNLQYSLGNQSPGISEVPSYLDNTFFEQPGRLLGPYLVGFDHDPGTGPQPAHWDARQELRAREGSDTSGSEDDYTDWNPEPDY